MSPWAELEESLRSATATGEVPGIVVKAATDQGTLYEGAFGKRTISEDASMSMQTLFSIASMTKAVTSVAAMQLVEQGKLTLDQDLGQIVPQLAFPQVLEGFDKTGTPKLRPAKRPITLRHLLTHTSGFTYAMWNDNHRRYNECQRPENPMLSPLAFDPGERWEYGLGTYWAGKAVEAISGSSLDRYFRTHIFGPLKMAETNYRITAADHGRVSAKYRRLGDGSLAVIPFEIPAEPGFIMGDGGLYSTAGDYLIFLQMLLNRGTFDGVQILQPETVQSFFANQIGPLMVGKLRTARPSITNDIDLFPDMDLKWGLACLINTKQTVTGRSAGSQAWAGIYNTYFWIDPIRRVTGVFLTQLMPFCDQRTLELFAQFETILYMALGT